MRYRATQRGCMWADTLISPRWSVDRRAIPVRVMSRQVLEWYGVNADSITEAQLTAIGSHNTRSAMDRARPKTAVLGGHVGMVRVLCPAHTRRSTSRWPSVTQPVTLHTMQPCASPRGPCLAQHSVWTLHCRTARSTCRTSPVCMHRRTTPCHAPRSRHGA